MADKKSYALPDSFQFRAFYAQKRRRSRNTNIVELLKNNTFTDNANARQYLVSSKGWIITDGGAA
tara:strand:+ start:397 stop:591 length:195 start_codon:yes stop_codon:yes gene_type:complete